MAERYDHSGSVGGAGDDCSYAWISEWLCEYVDGTMDPSMQAVFEEYMEANPELAAHVERLCRTRALLAECECRRAATDRAKARVHQAKRAEESLPAEEEVRSEEVRSEREEPFDEQLDEQLTAPLNAGTVAAVASAMTLMLGVGVVAGATLFSDRSAKRTAPQTVSVEQQAEHAPDRSAVLPSTLPSALGSRTGAGPGVSRPGSGLTWAQFQGSFAPQALLPQADDLPALSGRSLRFEAHPRSTSSLRFGAQRSLPLKKMPTGTTDSMGAPHSHTLVQTTGLNP